MSRSRALRRALHWVAASLVGGALLSSLESCADQAEGERCDPANNNSDCASGLACVTGDDLVGLQGTAGLQGPNPPGLCCAAKSTVDACQRSRGFIDADGSVQVPGKDTVEGGADAAQHRDAARGNDATAPAPDGGVTP